MSKKLYFNKTYDNNYLKKYMINVIILMTIKNTKLNPFHIPFLVNQSLLFPVVISVVSYQFNLVISAL